MRHNNDPSFWQFQLDNAQTTQDRELEAVALTNLGASYTTSQQYHRAIDKYRQAILIFQELGDLDREIWALNNLGTSYSLLGLHNRAVAVYLQALTTAQAAGALVREGWVLRSLGHTYRLMGQYDEAVAAVEAAIAVFQERGTATELTEAVRLLQEIRQEYNSAGERDREHLPDR